MEIVGSIPPLSESFRADLVATPEQGREVYIPMIGALAPYVDSYLCETMASSQDALTAAAIALEYGQGKPVYVSWTLKEAAGAGLRSGETVAEAYNKLAHLNIAGFLFNCCTPQAALAGLQELRPLTNKPIGAYPNTIVKTPENWSLDGDEKNVFDREYNEQDFTTDIMDCIRAGATIVGGCCGIGPSSIAALAQELKR